MSWETLVVDNNYEIYTEEPYYIRRKNTRHIIKEYPHHSGYIHLQLCQKDFTKHRILAIQFIPNPNNYEVVDHKNRVVGDNRLTNLHWVSRSYNARNITSKKGIKYEFVKELPPTAVPFEKYNTHTFSNYYFDKESQNMYYYNDNEYRIMHLNNIENNRRFMCKSDNGKLICVYITKLNKLF